MMIARGFDNKKGTLITTETAAFEYNLSCNTIRKYAKECGAFVKIGERCTRIDRKKLEKYFSIENTDCAEQNRVELKCDKDSDYAELLEIARENQREIHELRLKVDCIFRKFTEQYGNGRKEI